MRFVFWQNVVSIHQSAFIKALARDHDVTLVAAEDITAQRSADGWSVPQMGAARVIVAPTQQQIDGLLQADAKQVFSGIDAYPMVYRVFKLAIARGCDISVMMEPYQWQGLKGWLRRFKYSLHALRYGKYINHIFATGTLGITAFRKAGFKPEKIHQWGYFTEQDVTRTPKQNAKPRLIFVGSIDHRKNILALVDAAVKCQELYDEFLIVGGGPLESELKEAISPHGKIHYLGRMANGAVAPLLATCDLLVLPSLFDGWGAVVNEALSQGARVLCSDNCGASSLLDGAIRGGVFKLKDKDSLARELRRWLSKGALTIEDRSAIASWASNAISGTATAQYFESLQKSQLPDTPWITPPTKPI